MVNHGTVCFHKNERNVQTIAALKPNMIHDRSYVDGVETVRLGRSILGDWTEVNLKSTKQRDIPVEHEHVGHVRSQRTDHGGFNIDPK